MYSCKVILLLFHKGIQSNVEGESSSLSEVTQGFFSGTPQLFVDLICIDSEIGKRKRGK